MLNHKMRTSIFKEIKREYESSILPCKIDADNIGAYMVTYVNIVTMLYTIEASRKEMRKRIGKGFEDWFFKTHNETINNFWKEGMSENLETLY